MTRTIIIALFFAFAAMASSQAESRQQIKKICYDVGQKGNFKYWSKDSETLRQIKAFVQDVTNPQSANYVPVEERIAVFDLDGTLICETSPTYFEYMLFMHRIFKDPSYKATEKQKEVAQDLSNRVYHKAKGKGSVTIPVVVAQNEAFSGMSQEEYRNYVEAFMRQPAEYFNNLKWGEAVYLPMAEIVGYLAANGFQNYIVSGSERQNARTYACDIMAFGPNHIIGSDAYTYAESQGDKEAYLFPYNGTDKVLRGTFYAKNLMMNKVNAMVREIGIKPIMAFGNSTGDFSMFEYATVGNPNPSMAVCVLADDTQREFGHLANAQKMKETCDGKGWKTISMKNDFLTIYGKSVTVKPRK